MATSKSPEKKWIAGAYLYSGRRDPVWPASKSLVRKLQLLWKTLPSSREKPGTAGLGYRGAFLRAPTNREWFAFNGNVTLTTAAKSESREDPNREFERSLLDSAPAGILPPDFEPSR